MKQTSSTHEASCGTHEFYDPATERLSHYFWAWLPDPFDAVLHFDETQAAEPLVYTAACEAGEVPATFPCKMYVERHHAFRIHRYTPVCV